MNIFNISSVNISYKKILFFISIIILMFFGGYSSGFAISLSEDPCDGGSCFQSGIDKDALPDEIKKTANFKESVVSFINYALSFIGILLLLMVIYAGFLMITSQGDDGVLEKAKKMFIYAFLGIILIVLSYSIVSFLANVGKEIPSVSPTTSASNSGNPNPTTDNSSLQKSIDDLKKQLEALKNAKNPDSEKIANLEKELAALEQQMQTSTGSLQKDLEALMKNFDSLSSKGSLTTSEIVGLKNALEELKKRNNGNPELEKKYNEVLSLLDQLLENPNDANLLQKIRKAISDIGVQVGKSSEIMAKFTINNPKKTVPTNISVSAEKTYIRGASQNPLSNDSYIWSVIWSDGKEQIIGNGIQQSIPITESGNYIIRLQVKSNDANVLSGDAKQSFTALPADTEISFLANGKDSSSSIAFTMTENNAGIIFSPNVIPKTGRTISKVIWHFGNIKIETKEAKSMMYTFPKSGTFNVYIEAIDNTNAINKSDNVNISIQDIVAYFPLSKSSYLIGDPITFSGTYSKSDSGSISDFSWKFLNQKGETISQSAGGNTIEKFLNAGVYTAVLTVKDNKGKTASFYRNFTIISSDPIARFSTSQKGTETPSLFSFDASSSSDPSNQKITYSWDFDGDGSFEKTNLSDPKIEYNFTKVGTYNVTLEVTNEGGKKQKSIQKINVLSTLQLKIEVSSIIGTIQKALNFTAKHNGAKSFEWNFNDGTGKQMTNSEKENHTFEKSGKYLVTLVAYDEGNQKSIAQKMVFIGEKDSPTSVVNAISNGEELPWVENLCGSGKTGIIVYRNENITFSGELSVNKNGFSENLTYSWELPENNKDKTPNVLWKFSKLSENGKCEEIKLTVVDSRSKTTSPSQSIWVSVENKKPKILSFTIGKPKTTIAPVSIPLTLKTSDSDGGIRKYTWWATRVGGSSTEKIGLQSTQQEKTMILIPPFGEEGSVNDYIMHCEIEDNNSGKNTCDDAIGAYAPISIKTVQNLSPKVTLIPDKKDIKLGDTIAYTAIVKNNEGIDISSLSTYKWDFDGDNVFDDSTSSAIVSHKYVKAGKFTPRVKVTYQGLATSSTASIIVQLTSKLPLAKIKAQKNGNGTISLDGSTSDIDKTIEANALSYLWDFDTNVDSDGDGKADNDSDSKSPTAIATPKDGSKRIRVKLSIKDAAGAEDTTIQSISIEELSGVMGSTSEKAKKELQEKADIKEIVDEIKNIFAKPNPSKEEIASVKEKINTLKNSSNSAKTQAEIAKLEEITQQFEQNPSDTKNLLEKVGEVEKTIQQNSSSNPPISSDKKEALKKIITEIEEKSKKGTLTESDLKKAESILKELETDTTNNPTLKEKLQKTQESIAKAKQNISDQDTLKKSIENLKSFGESVENDQTGGAWMSISELGQKINRSLSFTTKNPSSILDMYGGERSIAQDEKITIFLFAKNADGSFYSGPINLKVESGSGVFTSSEITATQGRAIAEFTPKTTGEVSISASANLVSGMLTETLSFSVE